ncbi:helix-turn-helix domain-containing protein [Dubosiella newyorkensis]|uniref:helix-turn-helix domain-containing protein n=2 Tax=Dubosiella newyorkensis TaxID=1862672 RepID=UPI00272A7F11|nr:AraC family transcriptional regulator [Dubosiella newyorkensis]
MTGKAPMQFLLQYRMTKAAGMLQVSDMKIAEILQQVGYENQLHFSRAFKSLFNKSPKQYRQEMRWKKPIEIEMSK